MTYPSSVLEKAIKFSLGKNKNAVISPLSSFPFSQEEMERRIRQRLEMQQMCREQLAFKQLRQLAEKEEEEAFRQMMLAKFAEDDRIEQMNAQKRRMKQQEHKRAVEKLIEERRQQYLADKVRLRSLKT